LPQQTKNQSKKNFPPPKRAGGPNKRTNTKKPEPQEPSGKAEGEKKIPRLGAQARGCGDRQEGGPPPNPQAG